MNKNMLSDMSLTPEIIKEKIYLIRSRKVMLDRDLAILYGVPTKQLNRAVKRNIDRFPNDFMFELTKDEMDNWKYQIGTSNSTLKQSLRKPPLAFTEQGIAMLSSVLNSDRAISINIQIIRIFTKLREMIDTYKELREKVEEMEKSNQTDFREIFRVLRLLLREENTQKRKIGFDVGLS